MEHEGDARQCCYSARRCQAAGAIVVDVSLATVRKAPGGVLPDAVSSSICMMGRLKCTWRQAGIAGTGISSSKMVLAGLNHKGARGIASVARCVDWPSQTFGNHAIAHACLAAPSRGD